MLVPRSYKYSSGAVADGMPDTKQRSRPSTARNKAISSPSDTFSPASSRPSSPQRTTSTTTSTTEPVAIPSPKKPSNAQAPAGRSASTSTSPTPTSSMPSYKSATYHGGRRKPCAHDPNALPPSVAALLAVTAIPPRRPNRYRCKSGSERRISIEELVRDWKTDNSLKSSYGSSPALNVLLEDTDEYLFEDAPRKDSGLSQPCYISARSASSESMPSLESDDRSILSVGSPPTPESLRSRRSYQNLKKDKARSLPVSEDCASDHPLVPRAESDDGNDFLLPVQKQTPATKTRSSFKSNLTASLQNLKNAAVNSISSLGRANSAQTMSRFASPPMDDALWSHPFLFPRLSSEIRPSVLGTPSLAERRYLNPQPLIFEEQEGPFQQALHAPFLAEIVEDAPIIQMQTYNRGRKRGGSSRRGSPNPNSEAGRALLEADGVRHREIRENPDFLRVVVLEMNMRRVGKLEQGRAKIWLAPREVSPTPAAERGRQVPKRWEGVSAY